MKRFKFDMCIGLLIQELFVSVETLFLKLFTIQSRGFIHKVDSISLGILALNEKHFTTIIMQLEMERQLWISMVNNFLLFVRSPILAAD